MDAQSLLSQQTPSWVGEIGIGDGWICAKMWVNLFSFCCRRINLFVKVSEFDKGTYTCENHQFHPPRLWNWRVHRHSFLPSPTLYWFITFCPLCRSIEKLNTYESKGNTRDSQGNVTAKAWHARTRACLLSHDMTPFVRRHDTPRIHMCVMTHARRTAHSHVQHDPCATSTIICVTWHHSYAWHDTFICVPWLFHACVTG